MTLNAGRSQRVDLTVAFEELSTPRRSLSQTGYNELLALTNTVVHASRNAAHAAELGMDAEVLLQNAFVERKVDAVVQTSTNGDQFKRQLRKALDRLLLDIGRQTQDGALARRVADMLRRDDRFLKVASGEHRGKWALVGQPPTGPWNQDMTALRTAAYGVDVAPVTEWDSETRWTPVANDDDFTSVVEAVLRAAGGYPLDLSDIIDVVRHRFGLIRDRYKQLDLNDIHAASDNTEVEAVDRIEAERYLDALSVEARTIVLNSGLNLDELAERLGCSRSGAYKKRVRALQTLSDLQQSTNDEDRGQGSQV